MHIRLIAMVALLGVCGCAQALEARAPRDIDLSGRWALNAALSDDADAELRKRLEKQLRREQRLREQEEELDESPVPPLPDQAPVPPMNRILPQLREALGLYPMLEIRQSEAGMKLDINSAGGTRRFTAGSRSQVSMPGGQLADSEVGWEGDSFVIERKVRRGTRVTERYRLSKKSDQLEAVIVWKGGGSDDLLSGIKLKRVFDRTQGAPPPIDPDSGPVR